jgi:hypothetical protein
MISLEYKCDSAFLDKLTSNYITANENGTYYCNTGIYKSDIYLNFISADYRRCITAILIPRNFIAYTNRYINENDPNRTV